MKHQGTQADILIVEDSPTDVMLVREALDDSRFRDLNIHTVENGVKAMAFLQREGVFASAPRPRLILLDLNMPAMNGHEVLAKIKADESLMRIPVVVFTTSGSEPDVMQAYGRHANCYVTKPMDFDDFSETVRAIATFWLTTATLPFDSN